MYALLPLLQKVLEGDVVQSIELKALNYLRYWKPFQVWQSEITEATWSSLPARRFWFYVHSRYSQAKRGALKVIPLKDMADWVRAHKFKEREKYWFVLKKMRGYQFKEDDDAILTFLRRTRFRQILNEGLELLDEPDGLRKIAVVRDEIDAVVKLSERSTTKAIPYYSTARSRLKPIRNEVIPSGLGEKFDRWCGGGIGIGELFIFMGKTGIGKTTILCNVAAGTLKAGYNVVYVTLDDLVAKALMRRIDQILLGVSEDKIISHPRTYLRKMEEMKEQGYGKLWVLDYNDRNASVMDIRASIENLLDEGKQIDIVCVDYLDVMVSADATKDEQKVFLQICRGLKNLGRDNKLRTWALSQGNRQAMEADEIKLSQLAGAIAKAKAADAVFGVNQKADEKVEDLLRLSCLKARVFKMWERELWRVTDWDSMRILEPPK